MPFAGDHRVIAVQLALLRSARVDVNVGNHGQLAGSADSPEFSEIAAVETNDSTIETMIVQIVVQDEIDNAGATVAVAAEQERSAFPGPAAPALAQAPQQATP